MLVGMIEDVIVKQVWGEKVRRLARCEGGGRQGQVEFIEWAQWLVEL